MKVSVFVGRFQPPTLAHEKIFSTALERSDKVIVIVGSAFNPITLKNPFKTKERVMMIRSLFPDESRLVIDILRDSVYNFNSWFLNLQKIISQYVSENDEIEYIGHKKDNSSYYLDYFDSFYEVGDLYDGLSATKIRELMYEEKTSEMNKLCSFRTVPFLTDFMRSERFKNLQKEYQFVKEYKKQWENCPYPPVFMTTDAVVYRAAKVLLIKRGQNPGKGKYALPGGFLDQNETLEDSCIRELKEETKINVSKKFLKQSITKSRIFDIPDRDPRGRVITNAFFINLDKLHNYPEVKAADDANEAMWVSISELDELESNFFNDHLQIIRYFISF